MRTILCLLIVLVLVVSPVAAQNCPDAARAAIPLLENAKVRIENSETNEALVLIQAAQTLLSACEGAAAEMVTAAAETPGETPAPEIVQVLESETVAAEPPAVTNALVNAPDVNLEQSVAFIAFAHTSVDSGPIDLYMGRATTPIVANLHFGEIVGPIAINGGPRRFIARPAGSGPDGSVLYSVQWDYLANSTWILTAAGLLDELSFIVEPVSVVRNNYGGRTRVRVVNFVPARRVTVRSDSGIEFGGGLGWVGIKDTMVDPGSYTLQASADGEPLMEPVTLELDRDTTYTFYIIGRPGGEPAPRMLPIITPQDMTRVRFVSGRGDAVDIHYRPANARIVEGIAEGETSGWIALASGAVTFIAYAPGTGPTGRELAALPLQLRPGRDMTIAVNAQGLRVAEVVLSSP